MPDPETGGVLRVSNSYAAFPFEITVDGDTMTWTQYFTVTVTDAGGNATAPERTGSVLLTATRQ